MKPYNLRHELMKLPPKKEHIDYHNRMGWMSIGYVLTMWIGLGVLLTYILVSIITG